MNTPYASGKPRASHMNVGVTAAVLLAVAAAGITAFERNAAHATHAVAVVAPVTARDASLPVASDVFKSQPAPGTEDLPPTF